jgi:benzil reductase ((S)-benzoin forming)
MDLFIVTGASKGLGLSLAKLLLLENQTVVGIARSPITVPCPDPGRFFAIQQDLAQTHRLNDVITGIFEQLPPEPLSSIHLINNAAIIEPVGLADTNPPGQIKANLDINLMAPMILCSSFLRRLKDFRGWLTITNVSSGVAERPLASWSAYSTAKAGLKLYSHALAQETPKDRKLKVLSFSPGVMDTDMQATIRDQSAEAFPEVERFHALKRNQQLLAPDEVARILIDLLKSPEKLKRVDLNVLDLM